MWGKMNWEGSPVDILQCWKWSASWFEQGQVDTYINIHQAVHLKNFSIPRRIRLQRDQCCFLNMHTLVLLKPYSWGFLFKSPYLCTTMIERGIRLFKKVHKILMHSPAWELLASEVGPVAAPAYSLSLLPSLRGLLTGSSLAVRVNLSLSAKQAGELMQQVGLHGIPPEILL